MQKSTRSQAENDNILSNNTSLNNHSQKKFQEKTNNEININDKYMQKNECVTKTLCHTRNLKNDINSALQSTEN